jgi:hypothetical protein
LNKDNDRVLTQIELINSISDPAYPPKLFNLENYYKFLWNKILKQRNTQGPSQKDQTDQPEILKYEINILAFDCPNEDGADPRQDLLAVVRITDEGRFEIVKIFSQTSAGGPDKNAGLDNILYVPKETKLYYFLETKKPEEITAFTPIQPKNFSGPKDNLIGCTINSNITVLPE